MGKINGEAIIEFDDVSIRLGKNSILENVSFSIPRGEFVAVLGPNGAGKSTLLKTLLGLIKPWSGSVRLEGIEGGRGKQRVGYAPQFHVLETAGAIRAREIVGFGLDGHRWGPGWPNRQRRARIDEVLAEVDATSFADAPFSALSGGERQRLLLAQALLSDPPILLLDEPLSNLDISHSQEVINLVNSICRKREMTVLLVTHDVNPLLPYLDRVLYLARKHCLSGSPEEVITTESLSALYGSKVEVVSAIGRVFVVGAET